MYDKLEKDDYLSIWTFGKTAHCKLKVDVFLVEKKTLPRLLIIDDLFGRSILGDRNEERANLCGQFLLRDITGDEEGIGCSQKIKNPLAEAFFFRGQKPACAVVGDTIENDLHGTIEFLRRGWVTEHPSWSMVLLDLCFYTGRVTVKSDSNVTGMPEGRWNDDDPKSYFGLHLLHAIQKEFPDLPVIILSSKPREEVSREFAFHGALGFLPRSDPDSPEQLQEFIWRHGLIPDSSGHIIGQSKPLLLALREARRVAMHNLHVLIRGERGTGKELIAHYIHRHSKQTKKTRPFVAVDAGTLSPHLYASELFGHKRGAFTSATRDHRGKIAQADGGDLFLDEIGNIPFDIQLGLLRVMQCREYIPVGGENVEKADVRFLFATNDDIEKKSISGGFRADLLDRIREGGTIFLPSLQERPEDIPLLVEKFVLEAVMANPEAMPKQITSETLSVLQEQNWPGNVRELRNCIFKAINRYPDVEYFVPVHLELPVSSKKTKALPFQEDKVIGEHLEPLKELESILYEMEQFSFDGMGFSELLGKFEFIQKAYAKLIAKYLRAALSVTSKPTLERPDGEIFIHPAVKLMTGDGKITASKAADFIKRLLKVSPEAVKSMLKEDSVLNEAYENAIKLRPSRSKRKK